MARDPITPTHVPEADAGSFRARRESARPGRRRRWGAWRVGGVAAICLGWLAASSVGLGLLSRYASTPGPTVATPDTWPEASALDRAPDRPTLVVAIHPRCPCSRATIGQLEQVMTHARERLQTYVVMVRPSGMPDGWEQTDLWTSAARIPGVTVLADPDGRETRRFGAMTSGAAALYDEDGRLQFRGGLTIARGHYGTSAGEEAVISLVEGETPRVSRTDVFGCELFSESSCAVEAASGEHCHER